MNSYHIKLSGITCPACVKLAKLELENRLSPDKLEIDDAGEGKIMIRGKIIKEDLDKIFEGKTFFCSEFKQIN